MKRMLQLISMILAIPVVSAPLLGVTDIPQEPALEVIEPRQYVFIVLPPEVYETDYMVEIIPEIVPLGVQEVFEYEEEEILSRPIRDIDYIYRVYKNGTEVYVPIELQWTIRDMTEGHGFPEDILYGIILTESTFNPRSVSACGKYHGLTQILRMWIGDNTHMRPYRINDFYRERSLLNSCDNLITFFEMQRYAMSVYGLSPWDEDGLKRLVNWHSSGNASSTTLNNTSRQYFQYAAELILINYDEIDEKEIGWLD